MTAKSSIVRKCWSVDGELSGVAMWENGILSSLQSTISLHWYLFAESCHATLNVKQYLP